LSNTKEAHQLPELKILLAQFLLFFFFSSSSLHSFSHLLFFCFFFFLASFRFLPRIFDSENSRFSFILNPYIIIINNKKDENILHIWCNELKDIKLMNSWKRENAHRANTWIFPSCLGNDNYNREEISFFYILSFIIIAITEPEIFLSWILILFISYTFYWKLLNWNSEFDVNDGSDFYYLLERFSRMWPFNNWSIK